MTARRPRVRRREVVVFTEGDATEVSYIDAIKRLQDRYAVRVDDRHPAPTQLVELAIARHRELSRLTRDEELPEAEAPQVWCMFDRDRHPDVDNVIRRATAAGVRVAFSHPCFELWLLLHFRAYGRPAAGACDGLTDLVGKHVRGYKARGKRVTLAEIAGRYQDARTHAQRLREQHERDGVTVASQRDPGTDVWEFVDELGITY